MMQYLRKKIIASVLAALVIMVMTLPSVALADDPEPPPPVEDPIVPPPDIPEDWVPPENVVPPDGWVPPDDWVPPEDGDWVPPEGWVPPDDTTWVPPDAGTVIPPEDAGWIYGDDGNWTPPTNFTPPDWWTPPEGWQSGDPLPEGTAPWQQMPGADTPVDPFNPGDPGMPGTGDIPGTPYSDIPGGWSLGDGLSWIPPENFNPPEWWTAPAGWESGDPLPPGTAPWEQWTPETGTFTLPVLPGGTDTTTFGDAPVGGWLPGENGSWLPPAEFDPPEWWLPPEGWTPGEPLPAGTSPWEQIGFVTPGTGDFPAGFDGFFGPGGPSIGDLEGISIPDVPIPGVFDNGFIPFYGNAGNPTIGDPQPMYDNDGNPILDADGNQITGQPVLDKNGQPVTGPDGDPVFVVNSPAFPFSQGLPDTGLPGSWSEGENGGWIPPDEFAPPAWWAPPEGWEFGDELPAGTTPWEQIDFVDPVTGNFPEGFDGFFGPGGPSIGDLAGISIPDVPVPQPGTLRGTGLALSDFGVFESSPPVQLKNADGDPVLDENGDPVQVTMVLDKNGNPVIGPFGKPITVLAD